MSIVGKWEIEKDWDVSGETQIYRFKGSAKEGKVYVLLNKPHEIGTYRVLRKQVKILTRIGCDFEYIGNIEKNTIKAKVQVHIKGEGYYKGDVILRKINNS